MTKSAKKCLTIIMFTYDKEKINYGLSIICAAAAINRPTEILFAGENIYNLIEGKHLKKINRKNLLTFSNSEELLQSAINLGTSIEICSAALDKNDINAKQLRKDIKITIGGLVSTVSEDLSNRKEKDLIFI